MTFDDSRRVYYDHERQYRKIRESGGRGWDDLNPSDQPSDSYDGVREFLASPYAAFLGGGRTALDLGCGGGQVAMMLAQGGCVTHGIDYSASAVALARENARRAGLAIEFVEGDCLSLPYADRSCDVVTDNHVWHCIVDQRDRKRFLNSARRVLKRGGILLSEAMTCEGDFDPAVVGADPSTRIALAFNRYWMTRDEALADLRESGLEVLHERLKPQPQARRVGSLFVVYARRSD